MPWEVLTLWGLYGSAVPPPLSPCPRVPKAEGWWIWDLTAKKILLPLQAGVGEGGQGAAHGRGRRAAGPGEDGGGPEGEEGKARL